MDTHAGQQRRFPAVAMALVLFALCIYPGQYLLAKQFPQIAGLAQLKPGLIFLEIPVQLPFVIDLVLAPVLFLVLYPLVMLFSPSRTAIWFRLRAAMTGLFVLLCCFLIGGLIYYFVQPHLTQEVRNGINSMGMVADLHVAYPGYENIALRGSMVLFICFIIGFVVLIKKLSKQPPTPLTREQRMTPYDRMMQERKVNKKFGVQEPQIMPRQEHVIETNHSFIPFEPQPVQQVHKSHSYFCYSQPIRICKPEAMYFMPKV
jgi:hypothetical protein